ncbi:hypothetical protein B6U80_02020 [Candidatus Pacearchaeota archaeon ex4484_26]|nr:MAG: hypothetical protein B6U80_02020 [Candidatus Pacearchaeota archaeon ex4484_26]
MAIRYEKELIELSKSGARYLVIGAIALNVYGYVRATRELDILPELSEKNLNKVYSVLKNNNYTKKITHGNNYISLIKDKNTIVDLLMVSSPDFDECFERRTTIYIKDVEIPVASVVDLLNLKRTGNRLKDKYNIVILECLSNLKKDKDIQEYLDKFKNRTPYERLECMTELTDFLLKFMIPEGKEFFKESRLEEISQTKIKQD